MKRSRRNRQKRRMLPWCILFAVIAIAGLFLSSRLMKQRRPAWEGGYGVHISEVMTDNTASPNDAGLLYDYVEIENTTAREFDLSGYYLSDKAGVGKYLFPAGSRVPAHGYLVVWCDPMAEGNCAPFGLKKEGGETVVLMNANRVSVDETVTVPCAPGQSLVRSGDGTLVPTDTPTPGFPNNEAGARAWQEIVAQRSGGALELSEIMSSNSLYPSPDGTYCDWIEVFNPTDRPVALSGYRLSDREEKAKYDFPRDRTLGPGEYMVIWCVTGGTGDDVASFALQSAGGETVVLTGPSATAVDSVVLPALEKNHSYVKAADGWAESDRPTPGFANDEAGYNAYLSAVGYEDAPVYITEVMAENKAFCTDEDGDFSDWIELGNLGGESVDLTGWYLSDQEDLPNKWSVPSLTLGPGDYVRIWASGKNRSSGDSLHTDFSLSAGETVILASPNGTRVRSVTVEDLPKGTSLAYRNETFAPCDYPTPGYSNDAAGYEAFCRSDARSSPVLIWEAVSCDPDRKDWVELKNVSGGPVDLARYTLSDRFKDPGRMPLSGVLAAGETAVVELSGFGLSAQRDEIYLFDKNGAAMDWTVLRNMPVPGSYGRQDGENGFFYFTSPTPGSGNGTGWRMVSAAPTADTAPGIYREADSLLVTLSGEDIRYTTDGSTPTESSPAYTGPITVTDTTVLRARSFPAGQLPGDTTTLSYFLRETSTLPVVSLVTDRENLFGSTGVYEYHEAAWKENRERPATIAFFEDDGSFTIDCGIQIHGRTSRRVSGKRSLKLKFRGRYDGTLNYDVFGDGAVTEFSSLILRSSIEDIYTSYIRDILFAKIALENTDVLAQNYRFVTLYINGEYWGIYAFREHHSEEYFAAHTGVDPDTVEIQNGEFRLNGNQFDRVLTYLENHNMRSAEGWEELQKLADIPEIIDWMILECWGGNLDVYGNVRFYSSPDYENGQIHYGLADMDLSMMRHDTYTVGFNNFQLHGRIPVSVMWYEPFRDMFLTRLGEMLQGPMSTESVLAQIDELYSEIESEIPRDLARWGQDPSVIDTQRRILKNYTTYRTAEMMDGFRSLYGVTPEEMHKYFGDLAG
ncbi:MAG: lamin tail domain-containing protein [Oscillospiraceae bacterium]|nr:lamin tail domain-containing protein [Oscillospiraceae bacterium]